MKLLPFDIDKIKAGAKCVFGHPDCVAPVKFIGTLTDGKYIFENLNTHVMYRSDSLGNVVNTTRRIHLGVEEKFVPWTFETCPLGAVIVRKDATHPKRGMIVGVNLRYITVAGLTIAYSDVFEGFTMLDGSLCGTPETDSEP